MEERERLFEYGEDCWERFCGRSIGGLQGDPETQDYMLSVAKGRVRCAVTKKDASTYDG